MTKLVYKHFDKNIIINKDLFLHCFIEPGFDYQIICECDTPEQLFYRVIFNIDNGYNTRERIENEINEFVKFIKNHLQ